MYKCFPLGPSSFIGDRKVVKVYALLLSHIIIISDDATIVYHHQNYANCSFSISLYMRSFRDFPTKGCGLSTSAKMLIIITCEKSLHTSLRKRSVGLCYPWCGLSTSLVQSPSGCSPVMGKMFIVNMFLCLFKFALPCALCPVCHVTTFSAPMSWVHYL